MLNGRVYFMSYTKQFSFYLKTERDLSVNTIAAYLRDIKIFFNSFPDITVEDVTADLIREFVANSLAAGKNRKTVIRRISSLKTYFNYLIYSHKISGPNPVDGVQIKSREQRLRKSLPEEVIDKLLQASAKEGLKTHIIFHMLYGLGGRVTEVVSLTTDQIDLDNGYVSLIGKGNKERANPLHTECIALLREYIDKNNITSGYLFPNKNNPNKHQTRESVFYAVKRLAEKIGIDPKDASPHVFRHSYAQHLVDHGCDLATVQDLLGHKNINTTRIYATITKEAKKKNFLQFHPLA